MGAPVHCWAPLRQLQLRCSYSMLFLHPLRRVTIQQTRQEILQTPALLALKSKFPLPMLDKSVVKDTPAAAS